MIYKMQSKKAIMLISLVVTIIVLLILTGVALTALTGENGILSMAKKAREKTDEAQADEEQKLLMLEATLSKSEKEYKGIKIPAGYTPTKRAGEDDVNTGLVIMDSKGNEWVWIAVSADLSSYTTDEDIETALRTYANDVTKKPSRYEDRWYDKYGTVYDGINNYAELQYIKKLSSEEDVEEANQRLSEAQEYYEKIYQDIALDDDDIAQTFDLTGNTKYYVKITDKLNDEKGCGLTYSEYNNKKSKMLQSIKKNGGFFIGRYEAGYLEGSKRISGNSNTAPSQLPVIKQNSYPFNFVTCSQAEKLAESFSTGVSDITTSLMFGLQWDLVLKFLYDNGVDKDNIKTNSTTWGNYQNSEFKIDRGEWAKYDSTNQSTIGIFNKFNDTIHYDDNYFNSTKGKIGSTSEAKGKVLLTTGAAERNRKCNIYDFAGNLWEWTLERTSDSINSCTRCGGSFFNNGVNVPANSRHTYPTDGLYCSIGFRVNLY